MKYLVLLATMVSLSPVFAGTEREAVLFNGCDLAGWEVANAAKFAATNSTLRLVGGMGWLRSEKEYSDFDLELEWRALERGYDSGIFIRASADGAPWPKEGWQINLAGAALGALVQGNRTVVPAENPPAPVNKWVKFLIRVRGSSVELIVDGEPAWKYEKLDRAKGFIGIQAEEKPFEFRNIRLVDQSQGR